MISYREYQDGDWKAICQIHDCARPYELIGSCDPRCFIPLEEDKEVEDLIRSHKFVACEDEKVVGFVGVDDDYLAWLYVDPDHYGKDIGREILRTAFARWAQMPGPSFWMAIKRPLHFMKAKVLRRKSALPGTTTAIYAGV